MGVIIGSAVIPVSCVLMSSKVTGKAAISGAIGGFILAIITWFVVAKIDADEVTIDTLGGDFPMLFGNLVAILSSGAICGIVTAMDPEDYDFEGKFYFSKMTCWESTRERPYHLRPATRHLPGLLDRASAHKIPTRKNVHFALLWGKKAKSIVGYFFD